MDANFSFFQNKEIILASASPRRQALLRELGLPFTIIVRPIDESFPSTLDTSDVAAYIASKKADAFENVIKEGQVLLTSDTIVCLENQILGKPKDTSEAIQFLQKLAGKGHEVITGVVLRSTEKSKVFSVTTKVYFKQLSLEEINYYVSKFNPLDKAGSYGIQEWIGQIGVSRIEGCYYNVMGLPISEIWTALHEF